MMGKRIYIIFLILIMIAGFSGCKNTTGQDSSSVSGSNTGDVVFTDALGHEVEVKNPKTVVAAMGSFAETWLLAGGTLSGVTQDAYDERNLELTEDVVNVGDLKTPSSETIISIKPDLVILSANITGHVDLYDVLKATGIKTAYFDVETFEDYLDMLKICTDITGRTDLYQENGLKVKAQIEAAIKSTEGKNRPTVLLIRAFSTDAKARGSDNMTGAMLKDLGAVNIADRKDSLLENLSMEVIIQEDPDFIFVTTMGSQEKALEILKNGVESNPAWNSLSAVKNGRYIVLEKELFHYKPNARWGESYEKLAKILYGTE